MYNCENLKVRVMLFYEELSRNDTGFQNISILPSRGHDGLGTVVNRVCLRDGGNLLSLDGTESRTQVIRVTGPWDSVLVPPPKKIHVILIVNISAPPFLF